MDNKRLEEGGVFGVFGDDNAVESIYFGMYSLQHRGQTSCGVVMSDNYQLSLVKGKGLVREVIQPSLHKLHGDMGIAHLRYGDREDAELYLQPMISNYLKGNICISIGGKITNSDALKSELEDGGAIFQLSNDAEILAHLFARERTVTPSIEAAVLRVMGKLTGAYAVLIMSSSKLLAFRDAGGLRPLCVGKKGNSFYFASEDTALTAVGAEKLRDVLPGELMMASNDVKDGGTAICDGLVSFTDHCGAKAKTCIFEYLYFSRPDSEIDDLSVYRVRVDTGRRLAAACPASADAVIGVPSAGIHYAMGYAYESRLPYGEGLIRNYYLGRTSSGDYAVRNSNVDIKLSVIKSAIKGKRVVLVDDSMIRGATAKRLVEMLRAGGAKEVHVRIACPRFSEVCPFSAGILSSLKDKSEAEICKMIGADSLGFLPVDELVNIGVPKDNCKSCFKK